MPPAALGTAIYPGHVSLEKSEQVPLPLSSTAARSSWSDARVDSKELGLACGFMLGQNFFGLEDLHYGYWRPGTPVDLHHLGQRRPASPSFCWRTFPPTAKTVLDVGCGTGKVAEQLIGRGHQVDCVSPGPFLTALRASGWPARPTFFECRFEELESRGATTSCCSAKACSTCRSRESLRPRRKTAEAGRAPGDRRFFSHRCQGLQPAGGRPFPARFLQQIGTIPCTSPERCGHHARNGSHDENHQRRHDGSGASDLGNDAAVSAYQQALAVAHRALAAAPSVGEAREEAIRRAEHSRGLLPASNPTG